MGGCTRREPHGEGALLSPETGGGPFACRVRFGQGRQRDVEAQLIKSLTELLWVQAKPDPTDARSQQYVFNRLKTQAIAECVTALGSMRASQSETLHDFVVPVVNVMLHAPNPDVRKALWESFALQAVREDSAIAHLCYWALKAVASSPQAEPSTAEEAEEKLEAVARELSAKAQVAATLGRLAAANEDVRLGRSLSKVRWNDSARTTPLIQLLERLHSIGEEIVKVKDKELRQAELRSRLQKQVNEQMEDTLAVPALMLAPSTGRGSGKQKLAALLRLPPAEARVLSSKERAPYLVVLEVDVRDEKAANGGLEVLSARRKLLGCPCRSSRAARPPMPVPAGENGSRLRLLGNSSPSSASPTASCQLGASPMASSPALNLPTTELSEEEVEQYLREQDQQPKGAFNKETWEQVVERVRQSSEFGSKPNWRMLSLIVKSNADDVRQEELAYRLLKWFQRVFRRHKLKLWLHPFLIIATTHDGGCLETVTNAISLSDLKKCYGTRWHSLKAYFELAFHRAHAEHTTNGKTSGRKAVPLNKAVMNFIWSMASYSIICYVLSIRDRHNGNILIDDEGHILHVDFGFMLCGAPGGKALQKMGGFEHSAGFKLTSEFVEVLGQTDEVPFKVFRDAVLDGMLAVRQHADELLALLQLSMLGSENSLMNCFCHPRGKPECVLEDVCSRLGLPGGAPGSAPPQCDEEFRANVEKMVYDSVDHWRSRLYDKFQYHFTGVH